MGLEGQKDQHATHAQVANVELLQLGHRAVLVHDVQHGDLEEKITNNKLIARIVT